MTEAVNNKKLGEIISSILAEEERLQSFIFFLKKLENVNSSTDEISRVLCDYLLLCNNEIPKGKKRVRTLNDRHLLTGEQNIGFLNVMKIEYIATAVMHNKGLKIPIDIHDFKRRYKNDILRNDERGKNFKSLMQSYQEGDEIFECISPKWSWEKLCGHSFVVLERHSKVIIKIMKSTNEEKHYEN